MPQIRKETSIIKVAWVADNFTTGGIGTVCRHAAEAVTRLTNWSSTLVALQPGASNDACPVSGVTCVSLDLGRRAPQGFLQWLAENPHQFVITNAAHQLESAFPYFPLETLHVLGIHDSSRRHVQVAARSHRWLDGVTCVAPHITESLVPALGCAGFRGLLETVPNGATFPAVPARPPCSGPLRLLFMGAMDPMKGIADLVPILKRLKRMAVPVRLMILGGRNKVLERRFKRHHLDPLVTWMGWVSNEDCYRLAAENDVLLMPSRKEAFGMVTIEAMAMGCVPLAYDIKSGSKDIIEHGKSGLLLPLGDFRSWANSIKLFHENRNELRRISENAIERARTHFNEVAMATRLVSFLKRVQDQAQTRRRDRKPGLPPEIEAQKSSIGSHYQRLPFALRYWLRDLVGAHPHLCYLLLKRW